MLRGNDLKVTEGFQNMIYLAMFGGNVEASTPVTRLESEQAFDFWGNTFLTGDRSIQFNSETEMVLRTTALTSSGRLKIEQAVKSDLAFMKSFAEITVVVTISAIDRVDIQINVRELGNLVSREFIFIWDATKQELLNDDDEYIPPPPDTPDVPLQFDYKLDFKLS